MPRYFLLITACVDGGTGGRASLAEAQPPPAFVRDDPQPDAPADPVVTDEEVPPCPTVEVVLNEVSPSNHATLVDADGDSVDWIELVNVAGAPVDLAGWSLSDDSGPWELPSLQLDPGELVLVYASGKDRARIVGSWETRIGAGHLWRNHVPDPSVDADWVSPDHDDGDWAVGPSGFGHGDSDDATKVEGSAVLVRTELELTADELADLVSLALHVDFDDGFVAYLNGVEVARYAMGLAGSGPPPWDGLATYRNEARIPGGGRPVYFDLDDAVQHLREGSNTLALEARDVEVDSGDLSLVPYLSLGFASGRGAGADPLLGLPTVDLHTSFSLRSSGERVRLLGPDGCLADEVDPEPLWADESYGRQPDGTGPKGYFMAPTPGSPNTTESRPGFTKAPELDPPPGHHPGGTTVTITHDPAARVHVAWEGSEPTEQDPLYVGPLETGSAGEAVVLRARAWQDDLWPSRITTGTYLLEEPGDLPVVSIVTDPPNLWDEETGIYENWSEDGWERAAHAELWEPDGTRAFAVGGGVSIHGGTSREKPQKNFEFDVGSGWGDEDAIEHDLLPDSGITTFPRFVLRAGGGDWLGCWAERCMDGAMMRDPLLQATTLGTDLDRMASRPARVYLNGAYWGLYWINEKGDRDYVETHHGHTGIDLLKNQGIPVRGDEHAWLELLEWLRGHDLSDPAHYAHVQTLIDVEELQSYLAFQIFHDNRDWPGNNIKYWRPHEDDGRWRWMLFGSENGIGSDGGTPDEDTLAYALQPDGPDWPNPPWSTELFRLLIESPEFTETFVNRYADLMNTLLLPERTLALHQGFADELRAEVPRQVDRWGTYDDGVIHRELAGGEWERANAEIVDWLTERPEHARQHVLTTFGLDGTWELTLEADPPGSGTFELTAVTVEAPFTGTYFRGVPVTITAHPAPGYAFAGWSDPTLTGDTIALDPTGAVELTARFQ